MDSPLKEAVLHGFYDRRFLANELGPKLLKNDRQDKIWRSIKKELLSCRSFTWAVAFITEDMLVPLKAVLEDLAKKKVHGVLITGDYLGFNSPKVFEELQKIPNLEVRLAASSAFHAKGYYFDHGAYQTAIIGSANFTRNTMLKNYEWALKVSSSENAELTQQLQQQLHDLAQNSSLLSSTWIEEYRRSWQQPQASSLKHISQEIVPNQMQTAALKNLANLVAQGKNKALVVSATGTGKTYLGAFAVKDFRPKKFLYLVHRRQIARKSLASFRRVLGTKAQEFSLFSGKNKNLNAKYVFATVQTMAQDDVLAQLDPHEFDYILVDEAHRSASPSYQKILAHFRPKFLLGMTATPERMDNQDVFKIFDYNLAYEIRLQDALEEKMLVPFHYVGVEDYEADGQVIDETSNLRYLTADLRVKYVLKELDYYGYCGSKPRGLVFCSRQEEARILAEKFTKLGHPAVSLTNRDSESQRKEAVKKLEDGELEYIVTVDLFNEGIDIPSLNQIVMLRNTQSSIVFIQQLGRGLRKYPGKEFVTVLDFIGNYQNNYLIPLALNDDYSGDRDQAKSEVLVPDFIGLSTINFNQIAQERILMSLDKTKLDSLKRLRKIYLDLKQKIGRPPLLLDFEKEHHHGALAFINCNVDNYGLFLQKMGEQINLNRHESQVLTFVTQELATGKRIHELLLLQLLLAGPVSKEKYLAELKKAGAYVNEEVLASVKQILSLDFFDVKMGKTSRKQQYGGQSLLKFAGNYDYSADLKKCLQNPDFTKLFADAIQIGLNLSKDYQQEKQFTLYQRYDRKDSCRLLNWPKDVSAPMYGYRVGQTETPIFVTYKKDSDQKRNAIYQNTLANGESMRWYTRSPRHLDSDEVKRLIDPKMQLHLFVKRSDASGKEFFYLGQAKIDPTSIKEEKVGPKLRPAVGMDLLLTTPLSEQIQEIIFAN